MIGGVTERRITYGPPWTRHDFEVSDGGFAYRWTELPWRRKIVEAPYRIRFFMAQIYRRFH
jgi:hypothetical protein